MFFSNKQVVSFVKLKGKIIANCMCLYSVHFCMFTKSTDDVKIFYETLVNIILKILKLELFINN